MRRREGLVFMAGNDSWVGYDICHIQSPGACWGSDTRQQVELCLLILKWQQTFTSAASSDRYGKKGEVWNLEASAAELRKLKINDSVTLISFLHYPGRVHVCTVRPKHVFPWMFSCPPPVAHWCFWDGVCVSACLTSETRLHVSEYVQALRYAEQTRNRSFGASIFKELSPQQKRDLSLHWIDSSYLKIKRTTD